MSLSSDLIIDESDQECCIHCEDLTKKVERHSILLLQMKEALTKLGSKKRKRPEPSQNINAMNDTHVFIREEVAKKIVLQAQTPARKFASIIVENALKDSPTLAKISFSQKEELVKTALNKVNNLNRSRSTLEDVSLKAALSNKGPVQNGKSLEECLNYPVFKQAIRFEKYLNDCDFLASLQDSVKKLSFFYCAMVWDNVIEDQRVFSYLKGLVPNASFEQDDSSTSSQCALLKDITISQNIQGEIILRCILSREVIVDSWTETNDGVCLFILTHLIVNEIPVIANFARSGLSLDLSNAGKWKTNLAKWSGFHKAKKGDKALSLGSAKRELKKNIGVPYIQKVQVWMLSYFE